MCVWLAREVPCYRGVLLPHPSEASFCRYLRGFVAFFSLLPCMPLFIIYGPLRRRQKCFEACRATTWSVQPSTSLSRNGQGFDGAPSKYRTLPSKTEAKALEKRVPAALRGCAKRWKRSPSPQPDTSLRSRNWQGFVGAPSRCLTLLSKAEEKPYRSGPPQLCMAPSNSCAKRWKGLPRHSKGPADPPSLTPSVCHERGRQIYVSSTCFCLQFLAALSIVTHARIYVCVYIFFLRPKARVVSMHANFFAHTRAHIRTDMLL